MHDRQNDTRGRILNAAFKLFFRQGYSRVSVDMIAELAGVTKRTVYYHFESKDDLVAEVLDMLHLQSAAEFEGWVSDAPGTPEELLAALFSKLEAWAETQDWLGSGFTRITTELADLPGHPARRVAGMHKAAVEQWLGEQLALRGIGEPAPLARQIMILIEGAMSLTLIHGDAAYIRSSAVAAEKLVARFRTAN